jgi:hypothetical protein
MFQRKKMFRGLQLLAAPAAVNLLLAIAPLQAEPNDHDDVHTFEMVVSAGAKTCVSNAHAKVSIRPVGQVELMDVTLEGLPANTDFEFFVIQVPKAPFGVAWYQGNLVTDKHGRAHQQFAGRFSIETFAMAQSSAPAPLVFPNDASLNPPFNPIQMYHLGLWFGSPQDAQAAQCPATTTFFNGEHNAGLQVMNTSNFADDHGPLRDVIPVDSKQ